MIVYQSTKAEFLDAAFKRDIEEEILFAFRARVGHGVSRQEIRSWKESLLAMAKVLHDDAIPADCGVAVEYGIPQTSKRVDVLLSGIDDADRSTLVIVELKQWESAQPTNMDAIVRTRFSGRETETSHPSYQCWSYGELLRNFNATIDEEDIPLQPCAYLHNCRDDIGLRDPIYARYVELAPLFLAGEPERRKLRRFIARYMKKGDRGHLIYRIENGRIRPSRRLVDALEGMMAGRREFVLIDEQKLVFETALNKARHAQHGPKQVVVVEGGPGTGKSVVAINLLATLNGERMNVRYVSKNRAPRQVIEYTLAKSLRRSIVSNLFSGSDGFYRAEPDDFDVLIVDEAHRLRLKSGIMANKGDNQVAEVISAANCSIFFIDEDQRVTWQDIGRHEEIVARAKEAGADVTELRLESQFRCSGSDGYLAWLDDALGVRETANHLLDVNEFDFRVMDSPNDVRSLIEERNRPANRARMVAGYCWDWKSKRDPAAADVVIPDQNFTMQWNFASDEGLWIMAPESVAQIGCIHTSQGLEVDYIGVIIGPDISARDGRVYTHPDRRSKMDRTLHGFKRALREQPDHALAKADAIIRNTYRTLMTRGMKGCYVYCVDQGLADHLRSKLSTHSERSRLPKVAETPRNYPTPTERRDGEGNMDE